MYSFAYKKEINAKIFLKIYVIERQISYKDLFFAKVSLDASNLLKKMSKAKNIHLTSKYESNQLLNGTLDMWENGNQVCQILCAFSY